MAVPLATDTAFLSRGPGNSETKNMVYSPRLTREKSYFSVAKLNLFEIKKVKSFAED